MSLSRILRNLPGLGRDALGTRDLLGADDSRVCAPQAVSPAAVADLLASVAPPARDTKR